MTIRAMTADDLDEVFELGTRCFDLTAIPYNYWSREDMEAHFVGSPELCLAAEEGGRIVGFVLGHKTFATDTESAYLQWLVVEDDYRRRGWGRRLAEAALAKAEELGKARVVVDIAEPNAASRALAEELGFEEEVVVSYYAKRLR
jgi:ribosomal protein S18 acetylase RimI-like enzyme